MDFWPHFTDFFFFNITTQESGDKFGTVEIRKGQEVGLGGWIKFGWMEGERKRILDGNYLEGRP